ncbi:hypothetical protein, partial [Clostridium sp.]
YKELKQKHQEEVNNFPMFFAFSQNQFDEGMKKIGLEASDTDKIYSLGGGGFYKKSDAEALHEMFERHEKEMESKIKTDTTGEGFIYDMFKYELNNHEYSYTGEIGDTLDCLGLTIEDVNSNKDLIHGLNKACKDISNIE